MSSVRIHTIGHSTRTSDELVELLAENGIELLYDVRRYPASRRNPQFDAEPLARALAARGIRYRHVEALGGRRVAKKTSRNVAIRNDQLRGYADHTATEEFRDAVERVLKEARNTRAAVMCAEAKPEDCHRRILADWLVLNGHAVTHVVSGAEVREHALDTRARRDARGVVTWGKREPQLFD